jgi:DedD protein
MVEPADINVDELRRRARRRLVGAVVLALAVAVIVPMLLETEEKPLGEDVSVKIPPIDDGKFVNRLNENRAKDAAKGAAKADGRDAAEPPKGAAPTSVSPPAPTPAERTSKYDTRVADAAQAGTVAPSPPPVTSAADTPSPTASVAAAPPTPASSTASSANPPAVATRNASGDNAPSTPQSPSAAKAPAATSAHDGFAVQLAAFADDKGANALAGRLKKSGYAAYTEPLKTSKGTLWRVRVGPYPSRESAVAARDKLKSEGQSGIVAAVK